MLSVVLAVPKIVIKYLKPLDKIPLARVNKDRAFRRTPGRSCQVCYRCINKDPWKRQYHHRHMEHKDTKSSRETSGTNTRNGQVLINIPRLCEKRWKNFGEITTEEGHKVCSMEKRINTSMVLDLLFTRSSIVNLVMSWDVAQSPASSR